MKFWVGLHHDFMPQRFVSPRHSNGHREWIVRAAGATRAAAVTHTKEDAKEIARDMARRRGEELTVQRLDGVIKEKNSYGPDPRKIHG